MIEGMFLTIVYSNVFIGMIIFLAISGSLNAKHSIYRLSQQLNIHC